MSSRLRLLLDSVPLSRVDLEFSPLRKIKFSLGSLTLVQSWSTENVPLAHVVLVVEGTLRISGRDALGQPFTCAGSMRANGGAFGVVFLVLRLLPAVPPKPPKCLLCRSEFGKIGGSNLQPWLSGWSHIPSAKISIQRLGPLVERPRQDRTFLDEIDQLQALPAHGST